MTEPFLPVQPPDPRSTPRIVAWLPGPSPTMRYGVAVGAVAAALAISVALRTYLHPNYFFVILGAVVVAAWYGGLGPGLLASVLGLIGSNYFLTEPFGQFGLHGSGDVVRLVAFALLGYLTSALSGSLRRARVDAEAHAEEALRLAMQLQEQALELEQQAEEAQELNAGLEEQVEETERLRLELVAANDQLRASDRVTRAERERLRHILETMVEGVVLVDREGGVGYANPAGERILAAAPAMSLPIVTLFRDGAAVHGREVVVGGDGDARVLRVSAAPLVTPEGAADGAVVSFDDVTDRHRAEEALRESESRFRSLADAAPVLLWMSTPDGRCTFFNRTWLEFTGRMLEEELGDGWAEGVHPDDAARCLDVYRASLAARRPFRMEYRLRRADGEFRWMLDTGVPRFTPDGSFAGFIGSCIDINERHEAEEQQRFLTDAGTVLASSLDYEETLRHVCRLAVPVLADFCVIDLLLDGRIERVEAVSADPAQAALVDQLRRFPPEPGASYGASVVLRTGETLVVNHVTAERVDESLVDPAHRDLVSRLAVTAYAAVPLVAGGRVLGSILLCITRSGRRFDAADVHRAQELARRAAYAIDHARLYERALEGNRSKRDFLAVMSHELRTPLNAILGYTDLFEAGIPAPLPEPFKPQMARVKSAARHLLSLIEEILTFARLEGGQEEIRPERTSAATLAGEACALVEPLALERGIGFRVEAPAPDVPLVTDQRKARQILVNLLGNAVKFTEAGEVAMTVESDAACVRFHVHDSGIGIAPEDRERIFEPFWQAQQGLVRERGGSGLGLSVARQLARLLGGDVTVESMPGQGSTFTLRLPRGDARAGERAEEAR